MQIYDISMTIHMAMQVYKNREEKKPKIWFDKKIPVDPINESMITMNLHTGTHVDSPLHMMNDAWTAEAMDLYKLVRPCKVLDLTQIAGGIRQEDLQHKKIVAGDFVLLKTQNSMTEAFLPDFIFLEQSGARYLSEAGVVGVGIDALGIERDQPGHITHRTLMEKDIYIIEGLRLQEVPEGEYQMIALPLKIQGVDGAPARVILIKA